MKKWVGHRRIEWKLSQILRMASLPPPSEYDSMKKKDSEEKRNEYKVKLSVKLIKREKKLKCLPRKDTETGRNQRRPMKKA